MYLMFILLLFLLSNKFDLIDFDIKITYRLGLSNMLRKHNVIPTDAISKG